MKTKHLKQFFKATTLAVLISSSMHSFAQPTDEVVAIVDNSVILKSDLEQGMAEAAHELQAQKRSSTSTILTISSIRPAHLTSSTT